MSQACCSSSSLIVPRSRVSRSLFDFPNADEARRFLGVAGLAGLLYILAAPTWAAVHVYWQMYLLPFAGLSIVVVLSYLYQRGVTDPRWRRLLALAVLEIMIMASYTFTLRYLDTEEYAILTTERIRSEYLAPEHVTLRE